MVAQVTPPIMAGLHWGLYLILAAINVLAFIFVRYCLGKSALDGFHYSELRIADFKNAVVETRGKTLEEMARLFGVEEKPNDGEDELPSEQHALLRDEPPDEVDDN